ncbi:MAG: SulP family inorganic anion transporter [Saprospiraceae bacterium]|nr:SulP family inorganic anion transporter [Pyrinomonadaceae bacterium]
MNPVKNYNSDLLKSDLLGGISVAALSIPTGVAYAEFAGLPSESGLYTAIIALIAYFILGGSKQVIIGPDSATVTLFATTVIAVSAGNTASVPQFIMLVTVVTGVLMFVAGFLKLGFIANFLSKPILLGYLNAVSILLLVSQLGKVTGLKLEQTGPLLTIFEVFGKWASIHNPTFILAVVSLLFLYFVKKISVKIPSQLILLAITAIAAQMMNFESLGIVFMKPIENSYPSLIIPDLKLMIDHFPDILVASAAMVFVSFSGEIPVVQAFTKDKKGFDANKEFFALGLADILIGFFKGFPVSGADSRTAVNVAVGGKTKFVNIIAAGLMLLVILLIPGVFAKIPLVTFGAIIVFAAIGMFKRGAGFRIYQSDRREFLVFVVCFLGVLLLGVYQGILFALILSFIQLISLSSKPAEFEMSYDPESKSSARHISGSSPAFRDDVLIYRFNSALLFYNSNYFIDKLREKAASKKNLRLIVIDAEPINIIDLSALAALVDIIKEFNDAGVKVVFSGASEAFRSSVEGKLTEHEIDTDIFYPGVHSVFEKFE